MSDSSLSSRPAFRFQEKLVRAEGNASTLPLTLDLDEGRFQTLRDGAGRSYAVTHSSTTTAAYPSSRVSSLATLAVANITLVLFNMIPAFPMDGGRVLRALLAIKMGNARATEVAAAIGQGFAVVFGILGIFYNPMLIVIALFTFLAASGEAAHAQLRAIARGTLVSDAMITAFQSLPITATVGDAVDALIRTTQTEFPIVDGAGRLRGVLTRNAMIKALKERRPDTPVLDVMQADVPTVQGRAKLETALRLLRQKGSPVVGVTDAKHRLVGLMTVENLGEMIMVHSAPRAVKQGRWAERERERLMRLWGED